MKKYAHQNIKRFSTAKQRQMSQSSSHTSSSSEEEEEEEEEEEDHDEDDPDFVTPVKQNVSPIRHSGRKKTVGKTEVTTKAKPQIKKEEVLKQEKVSLFFLKIFGY